MQNLWEPIMVTHGYCEQGQARKRGVVYKLRAGRQL